ncbi:hypothetical protein [Enterobacter hormaechei]|uniref:hypothetical protein n=1 Tax=Enterobacter hormaechei TaxID=158836 RepID=UPI003D6EDF23
MSTITRERIEQLANGNNICKVTREERIELARIALASLEAEPAIHRWRRVTAEPYGPYPWHYGNFICFSKPVDGIEDEYYYAAPPAPVSPPSRPKKVATSSIFHFKPSFPDNTEIKTWHVKLVLSQGVMSSFTTRLAAPNHNPPTVTISALA